MTPMRCLQITAAAFALHVLLLPACVQWNMGERIRESAETRVGADVTQRFVCAETQQTLAPEVTYRADTPLVSFGRDVEPVAHDVTPTGQLRVVELPAPKGARHMMLPRHVRTTVRERWAGTPQPGRAATPHRISYRITADNARWLGTAERQRGDYYRLRAILAAPFDYCIDTALTVLSTTVALPLVGIPVLLGVGYDSIR